MRNVTPNSCLRVKTLRARLAAKAEEKRLELLFLRWSEHHKKLANFIRYLRQLHQILIPDATSNGSLFYMTCLYEMYSIFIQCPRVFEIITSSFEMFREQPLLFYCLRLHYSRSVCSELIVLIEFYFAGYFLFRSKCPYSNFIDAKISFCSCTEC